jgi:hypothetical protein
MERSALDFRVRAYNLVAVKSPLAQMNVMAVQTPTLTVEESTLTPPGAVYPMGTRRLIAPYDRYGYPFGVPALSKPRPFWTRYSLGVREAARIQRRRRRGRR